MNDDPSLIVATGLVRWWTRFYTCRMEKALREARRTEITSDLWESVRDAERSGRRPAGAAAHMLMRLLMGVPDDLRWRFEHLGRASPVIRQSDWATVAAVLVLAAMWIFLALQSPAMPRAPQLSTMVPTLPAHLHLSPPPPPQPPPPSR